MRGVCQTGSWAEIVSVAVAVSGKFVGKVAPTSPNRAPGWRAGNCSTFSGESQILVPHSQGQSEVILHAKYIFCKRRKGCYEWLKYRATEYFGDGTAAVQ